MSNKPEGTYVPPHEARAFNDIVRAEGLEEMAADITKVTDGFDPTPRPTGFENTIDHAPVSGLKASQEAITDTTQITDGYDPTPRPTGIYEDLRADQVPGHIANQGEFPQPPRNE